MEVDESDLFEELNSSLSEPRRRRSSRSRSRSTWSPEQLLDPMVLIATAPLAIFPERFPREAFIIAGALLAVPYFVRKSNRGRFTAPAPIVWSLLALAVVILPLSAWKSPNFWVVSWEEFVRFAWGMAVLMGVLNWCGAHAAHLHHDGKQASVTNLVWLATAGWFTLGAAFTAVGILSMRATGKVPLLGDMVSMLPEVSWLPDSVTQGFNANRVAGLAVLFFPFAVALALSPAGHRRSATWALIGRLLALAMVLYFGGALLLTQSRSALLAGFAALVIVSALAGRRGLIPLAAAAIVVVAMIDVFGVSGVVDTFSVGSTNEEVGVWQRVLEDRNMAGRLVIWRRALHGIADEPLTGMGLAGFEAVSQQDYAKMPDWQPDSDVVHAHNLILQTGLDLGLPGLLLLLSVVGIVVWEAARLYQWSGASTPARFWAAGAAGALTAFALYNMLDAVTVGARPAVSYWYLFGLVAGAGAALRMARQEGAYDI